MRALVCVRIATRSILLFAVARGPTPPADGAAWSVRVHRRGGDVGAAGRERLIARVTPHQTPGPSVRPNATYPTFHAYAASNSVWSHFQVFGNNSQYCDGRVIRIRGSTADNQASGSTLC